MQFIPNLDKIRDGAKALAQYLYLAFKAIEAKFPVTKQNIASVYGSTIDWTGSPVLPTDIIPVQEILSQTEGNAFISCIDLYRDGICQYRDDDSLFFGPGHLLHRGLFKRQTCNDDDTWVSALAQSLVIPDECPVTPGTTTGLEANTWYYVYWKLDVAGDGPEYRISKTVPVRCPGYGPEHPTHEKMRFVGSFRTLDDGIIKPFYRYDNGRVFWREIVVGPFDVTYNIDDPPRPTAGVFVSYDLDDFCPPSADSVFMSVASDNKLEIRTHQDAQDPAGYSFNGNDDDDSEAWFEVPINLLDGLTGLPGAATTVDMRDPTNSATDTNIAVVGYHEALL